MFIGSWEGGYTTVNSHGSSDAYYMINRQVTIEGPFHGEKDHPKLVWRVIEVERVSKEE